MSDVALIYAKAVYDNLKPLYANWEPTTPLQLGDYGVLRDYVFIRLGHISQYGIKSQERRNTSKDHKFFTSQGTTDVKFDVGGEAPVGAATAAKATLAVGFTSQEAVFFNAAGCEFAMIDDKVSLGKTVMGLYGAGTWPREWVVVTDLVTADAITVAVSGGGTASIVFEAAAKGKFGPIDLADASVGLTVKSASNIGFQLISNKTLTILLGLCKIQSSFLWWDTHFQPLSRALSSSSLIMALEDSPAVKTDESDEALFFGQLK